MQTKITDEIWQEPEFELLEPAEKLAVFWLLTKCNLLGWLRISDRRFVFETGADRRCLEGALKGLPRLFKVVGDGIWVRTYIRRQFGAGPALARSNVGKSVAKQLGEVPEEVRVLVCEEYPEIAKLLGRGLPGPCKDPRERERERDREGETREDFDGAEGSGLVLVGDAEGSGLPPKWGQWAARIYQAYPRKVARAAALRAIERVLQRRLVEPEGLLEAVTAYAKAMRAAGQEQEFIPHCATWMNAGRWEDDRAEWTGAGSGGQKNKGAPPEVDPLGSTMGPRSVEAPPPVGWREIGRELFGMEWAEWGDLDDSAQRDVRRRAKEIENDGGACDE